MSLRLGGVDVHPQKQKQALTQIRDAASDGEHPHIGLASPHHDSGGHQLTGPQTLLAGLVDTDTAVAVGIDAACLGHANPPDGVAARVHRAGGVGGAVAAMHVTGQAARLVGATSPGAGVAGVGRAAVDVGPVLGPRLAVRVRH